MTVLNDSCSGLSRIAVLASGRGSNFEALCRADTGRGRVALLLTDIPDAPVLNIASEYGVEALYLTPGKYRTRFSIDAEQVWVDTLNERGIDLICLAGLMRILKGPLLEAFEGRILNIHPSLLPSFPGLRSQAKALDYGVRISGCTVHYVDSGTDTGPVVIQNTVDVLETDDADSLSARILEQEHLAYPAAVRLHCEGRLRINGRHVEVLPRNESMTTTGDTRGGYGCTGS